jgi:hypothetical protein
MRCRMARLRRTADIQRAAPTDRSQSEAGGQTDDNHRHENAPLSVAGSVAHPNLDNQSHENTPIC